MNLNDAITFQMGPFFLADGLEENENIRGKKTKKIIISNGGHL